jgi:phosphoethanolamine N-methyltransferase
LKEFVPLLSLKPGDRVLDVGAGIGGSAFYMAETFDVKVLGIDLSANMISIAQERALQHKNLYDKVQFEICDVTMREFSPGTFDVVYTRDTLLHIADKPTLFKKFMVHIKGNRVMSLLHTIVLVTGMVETRRVFAHYRLLLWSRALDR